MLREERFNDFPSMWSSICGYWCYGRKLQLKALGLLVLSQRILECRRLKALGLLVGCDSLCSSPRFARLRCLRRLA